MEVSVTSVMLSVFLLAAWCNGDEPSTMKSTFVDPLKDEADCCSHKSAHHKGIVSCVGPSVSLYVCLVSVFNHAKALLDRRHAVGGRSNCENYIFIAEIAAFLLTLSEEFLHLFLILFSFYFWWLMETNCIKSLYK